MILRSIFFVVLIAITAFLPVWLFCIGAILYAFRYTAYELIILSIFIDGLYSLQQPFIIPYYTIAVCGLLICVEWVKPHISGYNQ